MINYNDSYLNTFKPVSDNVDILNHIHGIGISISGYASGDITKSEAPSAKLVSIDDTNDTVKFTLIVTVPVLGISSKEIQVSDTYHEQGILINVSHDLPPGIGKISIDAELLLKSFNISILRRLSMFDESNSAGSMTDSRIINIRDGYNTSVYVQGDVIHITGGPGLGKGMYRGSTDTKTRDHYKGIKSINGIRASRNVNIEISDLMHEYGASIK